MTTDGKPAAFVSVTLKELKKNAVTEENGTFSLKNIKAGTYTLVISHTGLEAQAQKIDVGPSGTVDLQFTIKESADQLDEVVVNAGRTMNVKPVSIGKAAINPMDLPQSVSIISSGLIRDQQAQRLGDVVKNVNGVYVTTTRGSTQESFGARGYGFSSTNMFKNGARVNSGVMPEMSSIERVEVLKGSAAILYGNVAPGGILNLVTKKPRFENGGELSMRGGSFGLYKPSFDVYGPISSNVAFRVNGTYEKANSYRDVVSTTRYYVNPSFLFKLGHKTDLIVEGDYLYHKFTPDFGIGSIADTAIPNVSRSAFFGTPWQYAKTQQATSTITLNHRFNEQWQLNSSVSYQRYDRDYYSIERIQAKADGKWARPLGRAQNAENYYVGQVNLNGKFRTGQLQHTLLAGIDAERNMAKAYAYNQPTTYDTINILDASKYTPRTDIPDAQKIRLTETPVNRFGAYVQDLISISEKLKFLAGIRWSYQDAQSVRTTDLKQDTSAKAASKQDKAFSPRVGIVYRPTSTTSVFASYANSFSVNSTGSVTDIYGNALKPSIIDQFELGIKNDFFKGAFTVNVTAYRIVNNNLAQTAQFDRDGNVNSNTNLKELTGQTTSDGVEVDLAAHPAMGLSILAGYSYNYMRYTKTEGKKGNYKEGERLVNNPAHTANSSVFYTFNQGSVKGLKLGISAFYTGKRFGGWNNQVEQTQQFSRLIPVKGFATLDFSAGYSFKHISLLAKVSNITNTFNYYVHENYSINPIAPRMVTGTVSYKF